MLLAVVLAGCTPAQPAAPKPGGGPAPAAAIPITSTLVTQGNIAATLVYSGNVQARAQVNVVPKITGRIERLFVDVGDEVRQGETIAELDRATLDASVQQAEAAVSVAQARLSQVQTGAKPEDVDAAQATINQAQARLDQAIAGARPEARSRPRGHRLRRPRRAWRRWSRDRSRTTRSASTPPLRRRARPSIRAAPSSRRRRPP